MRWEKLGLIFDPNQLADRGLSAALMPIVEPLNGDDGHLRVYFSPRGADNRSEFHFFEIDIREPSRILDVSREPLLGPGRLGAFDDSGVTPGSLVHANGRTLFYYTGWNLGVTVAMNNSIGVAEYRSDGKFHRFGDGPILTRTLTEPYSCASPFVVFENGLYRMWYASMDRWERIGSEPRHYYNIKYAESSDGLRWDSRGRVAIDYQDEGEYAFGRPFVDRADGIYRMWYAYRGDRYEIGYAESVDGISWTRKDSEAGISCSVSGWDSEMIEYPFIHRHRSEAYMFYNGNGYGKSGIGLARRVS